MPGEDVHLQDQKEDQEQEQEEELTGPISDIMWFDLQYLRKMEEDQLEIVESIQR